MKTKYFNLLFLLFILALPFSWANIGSMSIYRIVTIIIFAIWLVNIKFIIPIPADERRRFFFSWIAYAGYSIFAFILYPSNTNVVFGMVLLVMISLVFFSSSIDESTEQFIDYMWLAATVFFIVLFISGKSGQVGEWGARKTLVILGTPTDANEFSSFFVISLPVALYHIINDNSFLKKCMCSLIMILGLYVVLMGGSRGALLSVIVALMITVFAVKKPSPRIVFLYIFLAIALCFIVPKFILPLIPQDTLARLSLEALLSDNGSGRSQIWTSALESLLDRNPLNWILGCGYGGLEVSYSVGDTSTMHNQYLQQLVAYGIIGLVLYLRFIYLGFKLVTCNYRRYIGAFIGIMIMSLTLTMGPSFKMLWVLLFMVGVARKEKEDN